MTQHQERGFLAAGAFAWSALLLGLAATAVATAVWIGLTIFSDGDTTYHLFPLVIGASAALAARYVVSGPLRISEASLGAAIGLAAVLVGWAALVAADNWPSATFLGDQPGGVGGETVALGLLGAVIGIVYAANWHS